MDSEHKVKHILGKSTATDPVVGLLLHMLEEKKAVGMLDCCLSRAPEQILRPRSVMMLLN